jgi:hypothetical protein
VLLLRGAHIARSSHRARASACDLARDSAARSSHCARALAFSCSLCKTKACADPTSSPIAAPVGTSNVAAIYDCVISVAGGGKHIVRPSVWGGG